MYEFCHPLILPLIRFHGHIKYKVPTIEVFSARPELQQMSVRSPWIDHS